MAPFKASTCTLLALACCLTGCGMVREDIAESNRQGWQRFKDTNWGATFAEASGFAGLSPGPARREAAADAELCLHPNGQNRVIRQQGIEDSVAYRRCAVSSYPKGAATPGSRLGGR